MLLLIHKKKEKTSDSFWPLWSEYQSRLRHCCLRWLNGNYAQVEDALSQAREKSYRYFTETKEPIRNPYSWLCKLTYTICIDIRRDQKKQLQLCDIATACPNQFFFSSTATESLEEGIQRDKLLEQLDQAIHCLSPELQKVIHHRFIEEMDYPEIAEQMQISQANVRKRVQLARARLRHLVPC
ncbi:RNA polymerase sigma factor [Vibrio aerogenes]|uniref:RNA polymerase sigma factor n=1 Tax=Vibrio aerogenes TaxID=92172 RepID=UPI000937343A|nr:sigma-70 family RNA polymerase sigma factor [Vibrio aerogenes]